MHNPRLAIKRSNTARKASVVRLETVKLPTVNQESTVPIFTRITAFKQFNNTSIFLHLKSNSNGDSKNEANNLYNCTKIYCIQIQDSLILSCLYLHGHTI